mgnify:FL=1
MLLLSHNFACYYHIKGFNIMHKFIIPNIEDENTITKTIRIRRSTANKLENLAINNNITFNRLVNECINYALQNMEEDTKEKVSVQNS